MNTKTIILVIILAIIIGTLIFFVPKIVSQETQNNLSSQANTLLQNQSPTPTPQPTPNPPTIDENSNLKEEINKVTIPDFAPDFQNLKNELQ